MDKGWLGRELKIAAHDVEQFPEGMKRHKSEPCWRCSGLGFVPQEVRAITKGKLRPPTRYGMKPCPECKDEG